MYKHTHTGTHIKTMHTQTHTRTHAQSQGADPVQKLCFAYTMNILTTVQTMR